LESTSVKEVQAKKSNGQRRAKMPASGTRRNSLRKPQSQVYSSPFAESGDELCSTNLLDRRVSIRTNTNDWPKLPRRVPCHPEGGSQLPQTESGQAQAPTSDGRRSSLLAARGDLGGCSCRSRIDRVRRQGTSSVAIPIRVVNPLRTAQTESGAGCTNSSCCGVANLLVSFQDFGVEGAVVLRHTPLGEVLLDIASNLEGVES
jgi:hypothetical protein